MDKSNAVYENEYSGELFVQQAKSSRIHSMPRVHYHDNYEIYYLVSGKRRYFIENHIYNVNEGDLLFVPMGAIHKTAQIDNSFYTRVLICFGENFIPKEFSNDIQKCFGIKYFPAKSILKDEIKGIINKIKAEYEKNDAYSVNNVRSLLQLLSSLLLRSQPEMVVNESLNTEPVIQKAVEYIGENYANDVSLETVASLCNVSKEHLSRSFKKYAGLNFQDYVTQIRLMNAEKLLIGTQLTVSEIAFICGYNDSNYFSAVFRKNKGISPRNFRVKAKSENNLENK